MKKRLLLPSLVELAILGAFAVIAAVVVASRPDTRAMMIVAFFPLMLTAMLMGARRSGQLSAKPAPLPISTESAPADSL